MLEVRENLGTLLLGVYQSLQGHAALYGIYYEADGCAADLGNEFRNIGSLAYDRKEFFGESAFQA